MTIKVTLSITMNNATKISHNKLQSQSLRLLSKPKVAVIAILVATYRMAIILVAAVESVENSFGLKPLTCAMMRQIHIF